MKKLLLTSIFLAFSICVSATNVNIINGKSPLHIHYANGVEVVNTAIKLLSEDVTSVSGTSPIISHSYKNMSVWIAVIGQDSKTDMIARSCGIPIDSLRGKWEAFRLETVMVNNAPVLFIIGSDARGTAYGILELSKLIGVSPWKWWADCTPSHLTNFSLPLHYINQQQPSVAYRGIFINDEDFGLNPWSNKTMDPSNQKGHIGPKTYEKVFELLLRLRANTLWPAMHKCSVPFFMIEGNREMAKKYGITIGTSHCEPMMCNINGEWDIKKLGAYNYLTNRSTILDYWSKRTKETAIDGDFYTIGMRGMHDGPMEGTKSISEQRNALTKVINDQRDILKTNIGEKVPQLFVQYKEVLQVYESGLKIPDDVTLMWCDDNYGYLTRLSNKEEQKRIGGAGIYYHISYWGRPHDYLWLCTTQPALIYNQMKRAYDHNASKIWILNVGDIKPAEYDIEFFMDLAWNINGITPSTVNLHLNRWLTREFGKNTAASLTNLMLKYYQLAQERRPEFMGWSRTEEPAYPGGITPIKDTEYTNEEAENRIKAYESLQNEAMDIEHTISPEKRDAFFELIKYPVCGAALMNKKVLYAQLARDYLRKEHVHSATLEKQSEQSAAMIDTITKYYNDELHNGKWKYIISSTPHNLPVFQKPIFSADSSFVQIHTVGKEIIQWNGDQYLSASEGTYTTNGLGVSMRATSLPQNGTICYQFNVPKEGNYTLRSALLPLQPIDGKDLRYILTIDDLQSDTISLKTKFRDETWKQNVLCNQARHNKSVTLTQGLHKIKIKALDDGIIVDEFRLYNQQGMSKPELHL